MSDLSPFEEMRRRLQKPEPSALSKQERRRGDDAELRRNAKAARERDGGRCRICGTHLNLETHHLVPRSLSGRKTKHQRTNLVTLCGGDEKSCHVQVTRHIVQLHPMTERGADGPLRVSKFDRNNGGFVIVTESA
jgi:5-methylcytosine-specific restriction endonuclease McrA